MDVEGSNFLFTGVLGFRDSAQSRSQHVGLFYGKNIIHYREQQLKRRSNGFSLSDSPRTDEESPQGRRQCGRTGT
jgi:hypothetical protein